MEEISGTVEQPSATQPPAASAANAPKRHSDGGPGRAICQSTKCAAFYSRRISHVRRRMRVCDRPGVGESEQGHADDSSRDCTIHAHHARAVHRTQIWEQIDLQGRDQVKAELGKLVAKAKKAGVRATTLVVDGDPARHIVGIARPSALTWWSLARMAGQNLPSGFLEASRHALWQRRHARWPLFEAGRIIIPSMTQGSTLCRVRAARAIDNLSDHSDDEIRFVELDPMSTLCRNQVPTL